MPKLGDLAHKVLCSEIMMGPEVQIFCVLEEVLSAVEFMGDMKELSAFCQGPAVQVLVGIKEPFDKAHAICKFCSCQEGSNTVIVLDNVIESLYAQNH